MTGKFIVVEGPDGVGKTSLCKAIVEALGDNAVYTREPGGTPMAEEIRQLFKSDGAHEEECPLGELYLVMAARAYHCRLIEGYLARGMTVICDRWMASTYIYQCQLGGVSLETLNAVEAVNGFPVPDIQFITSLEDGALASVKNREGEPVDYLDERSLYNKPNWEDNKLSDYAHTTVYTRRHPTPAIWAQHLIDTYL